MTVRTDALLVRAKDWYAEDHDLAGLVLYGSAATGQATHRSGISTENPLQETIRSTIRASAGRGQ